ncbi:hypothetical protein K1719_039380 [Acacia pycnantha]|nr:hypothetical protein K1719_039380 [Acacia pycnantha]
MFNRPKDNMFHNESISYEHVKFHEFSPRTRVGASFSLPSVRVVRVVYEGTVVDRSDKGEAEGGLDIIKITGKAFMFKFEDEEEYSRILRGHPWSINGSLLNLMERPRYKACEEFIFSHSSFWIQIHNVPLEVLCLKNAISIGGNVGEVLIAKDLHYNGRHDCNMDKTMEGSNHDETQFGAWLATPVSRSWEETLVVVRCEGAEVEYIKRKKVNGPGKTRESEDQETSNPKRPVAINLSEAGSSNCVMLKTNSPKIDGPRRVEVLCNKNKIGNIREVKADKAFGSEVGSHEVKAGILAEA